MGEFPMALVWGSTIPKLKTESSLWIWERHLSPTSWALFPGYQIVIIPLNFNIPSDFIITELNYFHNLKQNTNGLFSVIIKGIVTQINLTTDMKIKYWKIYSMFYILGFIFNSAFFPSNIQSRWAKSSQICFFPTDLSPSMIFYPYTPRLLRKILGKSLNAPNPEVWSWH